MRFHFFFTKQLFYVPKKAGQTIVRRSEKAGHIMFRCSEKAGMEQLSFYPVGVYLQCSVRCIFRLAAVLVVKDILRLSRYVLLGRLPGSFY